MINTGSYLNVHYNQRSDAVTVWERNGEGDRTVRHIDPQHYFYIKDKHGEFTSIFGDKLKRLDFGSKQEHEAACNAHRQKFESDIRPADRVLMDMYYGNAVPSVHYTLLDIEVDYDKEIGFSSPENPYAPINAITLYHQWLNKYVTIAVPPPGYDWAAMLNQFDQNDPILSKSEITLVTSEAELLSLVLDHIRDSDVVSGWNSEFFDLPYLVRRTEMVLGKTQASRWSYLEAPPPRYSEVERFGSKSLVVKLYGRDHLDYLDLFKKFTFEGRASYSLANIAEEELTDIPKLEYEGSLASLYTDDFVFFIKYNIRDVEILEMLDKKFKFIDLATELAHANTVPLEGVMGSVRIIDTGIINYCHHELNLIVMDKENKAGDPIKGAMVLEPKVGLHEMIGSIDINSLYPSTYRALNISPEKIIGQFENTAEDWEGISKKDELMHTMSFENGDFAEYTGEEWYEILKGKQWAISAYGTVFDQSSGPGFIPLLLADWYANRKRLQKQSTDYKNKVKELEAAGATKAAIKENQDLADFYDRKQLVYKILLNSLYGATINEWCRFYDPRLGASTTFTGRQITSHMAITAGEILTGVRTPVVKTPYLDEKGVWRDRFTCDNEAIIYGDTDSCYFKMLGITDKAAAIEVADMVGEAVNTSFPPFMEEAFCCTEGFMDMIKCGREVVADRAIFQAKKKYMLRCINIDGYDIEPGSKKSIKAMGSDIKKSDTPKFIQKFLRDVTNKILAGGTRTELAEFVNNYRKEFREKADKFSMARIMSVNNLDQATDDYMRYEVAGIKRVNISGHARAAINFNRFIKKIKDTSTLQIISGQKVKIFFVKKNDEGYDSIAIASDLTEFPKWFFKYFDIDLAATEEKLVDAKVKGIFGAIGWEIPTLQGALTDSLLEF